MSLTRNGSLVFTAGIGSPFTRSDERNSFLSAINRRGLSAPASTSTSPTKTSVPRPLAVVRVPPASSSVSSTETKALQRIGRRRRNVCEQLPRGIGLPGRLKAATRQTSRRRRGRQHSREQPRPGGRVVLPRVAWSRHQAREHPQTKAFVIDLDKVSEPTDRSPGICA